MTRAVVADATVLIYLARLGELRLLDDLFEEALVPGAVRTEVVDRGSEEGYADALAVDEATDEFLAVRTLEGEIANRAAEIRDAADLGSGESEAIALARATDSRCLTDDRAARRTAESLGVAVGGTIYVLLEALDSNRIDYDGYVELLDELTESGFRISASLYREALAAARDLAA